MKKIRRKRGQTIVEYVLIIAIVVVAAIGVLAAFSDTVREKISGIVHVFGSDTQEQAAQDALGTGSEQMLRELGPDGQGGGGS